MVGAVKPAGGNSKYSGSGAWQSSEKQEVNNQAQNIADYDYNIDEDEEIKFETVSHKCASSVQNARLQADLTQAQLASKCNEKTSVIVDVENGTARYDPGLINAIEKALNAKIDRGRKKPKKRKN